MHAPIALSLFLAASAAALQVTYPSQYDEWKNRESNELRWNAVGTDPSHFSVVLSNQNQYPPLMQILYAQVDTSDGVLSIPPPSDGFPTGEGFRVNLVKSDKELDSLLAQSPQFDIVVGGDETTSESSSKSGSTGTGRSTIVSPTMTRNNIPGVSQTDAAASASTSPSSGAAHLSTATAGLFLAVAVAVVFA